MKYKKQISPSQKQKKQYKTILNDKLIHTIRETGATPNLEAFINFIKKICKFK